MTGRREGQPGPAEAVETEPVETEPVETDSADTDRVDTAATDEEVVDTGVVDTATSDQEVVEAEVVEDASADAVDAERAVKSDLSALEAEVDEHGDAVRALSAERDEFLDALRRLQADFENYKKRMIRQQTEHLERAAEALVVKLLPVLDSFDLALAHGADELEPVYRALFGVLESEGLQRVDPLGQPFDPTQHDAVAHEEGEGETEVVEVLRAGYRWKDRVLRPAMVKVKG